MDAAEDMLLASHGDRRLGCTRAFEPRWVSRKSFRCLTATLSPPPCYVIADLQHQGTAFRGKAGTGQLVELPFLVGNSAAVIFRG